MLDINLIRENPDLVRTALKNRQMEATPVDAILRLDEKRRTLLTQVEQLKAERNVVSKEIDLYQGKPARTRPDRRYDHAAQSGSWCLQAFGA